VREAATGWKSDFFGQLNAMPPEPVTALARVLEAMSTEPTFRGARRALVQDLALPSVGRVLEGGCGTGAALPDLLAVVGPAGQIVGIDPTEAFIVTARERAARLGARHADYRVGDIRALPAEAGGFDAAFCDKVLIHVGPPDAVLRELVRVTRRGGRVGALEWQPHFVLSTTRPVLASRFNDLLRHGVYDFDAPANLTRYFHEAGLAHVETRAYLAHARSLDEHPFWRAFLIDQIPLFVAAGRLAAEDGRAFVADLEALDSRGEFSASVVVLTAAGTKSAA
jgi:ubiquinone/menaquinone biosynthesis C-methylase UbiE